MWESGGALPQRREAGAAVARSPVTGLINAEASRGLPDAG